MIKYMRSHLTAKIFLITAAMLLASAAVTYGFIALYAPGHYLIAVEENLSQEAEGLVSEMKQAEVGDAEALLEQFSTDYTVTLSRKETEGEIVPRKSKTADANAASGQKMEGEETKGEGSAAYEFQFKDSPETYTLTIRGTSQSSRPFTIALKQILPPLMAVVFILAFIVSVFYSRYITRPVIEISRASKKLAALDFDVSCREGRDDELGELAGNLNELSRCLESALEELKQANTLLKEDVEREKELEGQQLAFFSAVSHELKTPITVLKGQLQGMICCVGGYRDRDKYLKRAFEVACAMENLVMEILTVSRMKSSGFSIQTEEIRLTDFVKKILDGYEELLCEKELQAVMEAPCEDGDTVHVDKRLFAKAISNLISNACHYSPSGEEIRIRFAGSEEGLQLSIENTGVHIPDEEIPGLFEAFTRREQSRSRETGGSGLGLFIVRMVLDLHHFSYHMENTGEGVRFSMVCK